MYSRYEALKFDRTGSILTITMSNPPLNSMTRIMHRELATVFADVARDESASVLILTGEGERAFSAGGDIKDMQKRFDEPAASIAMMAEGPEILRCMLDLDKPIIARVNGAATGLGATLALFCDIIIAVDTAIIADPHVKAGLVAGDGGALIWPHLIGYARAKEYLLTGRSMAAPEAARIGLINYAVPRAELDGKVGEFANELAAGASPAIRGTKRAVNLLLRKALESTIEAHMFLEIVSKFTPEHREAVDAFLEKRAPRFGGR